MKTIKIGEEITKSPEFTEENLNRFKELFPEVVTEDGVNVDTLNQLIGKTLTDVDEKYGLNWYGKRRARQFALTPSIGTLRPSPEESVDWDITQNLMIEGDNLEVLKLLQKAYSGKVKLIYIDPPYNTGKDFVYPDNYQDNIKNYLKITGQVGEEGQKISSNTETSGRFHTIWLNMIYPRLKLARDLLTSDGIIFITIGDNELSNACKCCDDVFGEENFVSCFIWEKRTNRENRKMVSSRHDYLLCYCKNFVDAENVISALPMNDRALARYQNPDNDPRGPWKSDPATAQEGHATPVQFYVITAPNGKKHYLPSGRCWTYTEEVMKTAIQEGRIWFGRDGNGVPRIKTYLESKERGLTPETIWFASEVGTNEGAKNDLKDMFDGSAVFDTPKPILLVQQMLRIGAQDGIIMDFFAGSGTTGHAVMAQNADDGSKRRYILVQLPEPLDPNNQDQKTAANYCDQTGKPCNIAEITKERLRRAAKKIKTENSNYKGDLGFRVFKLDSSNVRTWEPDREDVVKSLQDSVEHIKSDRTEQDILFEIMLKLGYELTEPINKKTITGKTVYNVNNGALIICLDRKISVSEVENLSIGIVTWRKEQDLTVETTVIFRDSAFENDVAKTNLSKILEQNGIKNIRSL
jgi:adenine-specific DNA-methyltransferase